MKGDGYQSQVINQKNMTLAKKISIVLLLILNISAGSPIPVTDVALVFQFFGESSV